MRAGVGDVNEMTGSLQQTAAEILRKRAESLSKETFEEEVSDKVSLLLFRIGEEWYCVRVVDVREIFQDYAITKVPCVPKYVLGVVNVRGEILSVTDPGICMGLGSIEGAMGENPPAIVVVNGDVATAVVVDEIGDIADVPNEAMEPPVSIIDRLQAEFIAASVHVGDTMVGMLNIERMLEPVVSGRH
jgi:purine-binding chemotaxis protein CheW